MKEIGERIVLNANYASRLIEERKIKSPFFSGSYFGDVTVKTKLRGVELSKKLADSNILGGLPLGRYYSDLEQVSVFSFSEVHTASDIEFLADTLGNIEATF
jgi:glycine cleavage system pyridoxal-binding protein P